MILAMKGDDAWEAPSGTGTEEVIVTAWYKIGGMLRLTEGYLGLVN